eukprot:4918691-Amphidinium_carterae.1
MAAAPSLEYRLGEYERLVHNLFFLAYLSHLPAANRKGLQTSLPLPPLTKELELKRRHALYQTTKATGGCYVPGLGKASLLQTSHPQ